MNSWFRLIGRLLFIFVWLFLISLPVFAFALAARQQIQFGKDEHNHLRIFLLQQKDAEGIGIELIRPFSESPHCDQASVRYFLWTGSNENVTFCHCYDPQDGGWLPAIAGTCNPP